MNVHLFIQNIHILFILREQSNYLDTNFNFKFVFNQNSQLKMNMHCYVFKLDDYNYTFYDSLYKIKLFKDVLVNMIAICKANQSFLCLPSKQSKTANNENVYYNILLRSRFHCFFCCSLATTKLVNIKTDVIEYGPFSSLHVEVLKNACHSQFNENAIVI